MIKQGIWKHWKGGEYDVIGVALNRDTGQEVVVYRPRYGERRLEYKTVEEWGEWIVKPDYEGPRYWLLMSNQELNIILTTCCRSLRSAIESNRLIISTDGTIGFESKDLFGKPIEQLISPIYYCPYCGQSLKQVQASVRMSTPIPTSLTETRRAPKNQSVDTDN